MILVIECAEGERKKLICLEGKFMSVSSGHSITSRTSFSFDELAIATKNFKELLGVGGFGSVYKGRLPNGEVTLKTLVISIL